ncbi:MAG: hypothetical protein ABIR30_14995 [Chitinophagaceae bacterium]
MKKIIYLVITLVYTIIGIMGDAVNSYIQKGAGNKLIRTHGVWFFIVSVLVGLLAAYFFTKVYPKAWAQQRKGGKILIPVLLLIFSFALTIGVFKFTNAHLGKQTKVTIKGRIANKWFVKGAKRTRTYYLRLSDSPSGKEYEFRVRRKVYDQLGFMGSTIEKDFFIGSLGIMYRHSY